MATVLMSRKEKEEHDRKRHILTVAERLFAQNGYYTTTVSDIAKEAEFGIGTLYKHFKDKDSLFQKLINMRVDEHFTKLEEALASDGTPHEVLEKLIDAYIDSMDERKDFFNVFFAHVNPKMLTPDFGSLDMSAIYDRRMALFESMENQVTKGQKLGMFVQLDPMYLVSAMFGMLISYYYMAYSKFGYDWDVDGMKASFKRILFGQVLLDNSQTSKED